MIIRWDRHPACSHPKHLFFENILFIYEAFVNAGLTSSSVTPLYCFTRGGAAAVCDTSGKCLHVHVCEWCGKCLLAPLLLESLMSHRMSEPRNKKEEQGTTRVLFTFSLSLSSFHLTPPFFFLWPSSHRWPWVSVCDKVLIYTAGPPHGYQVRPRTRNKNTL